MEPEEEELPPVLQTKCPERKRKLPSEGEKEDSIKKRKAETHFLVYIFDNLHLVFTTLNIINNSPVVNQLKLLGVANEAHMITKTSHHFAGGLNYSIQLG